MHPASSAPYKSHLPDFLQVLDQEFQRFHLKLVHVLRRGFGFLHDFGNVQAIHSVRIEPAALALRKLLQHLFAFRVAVMQVCQLTRMPYYLLGFAYALLDFRVLALAQKRFAAPENLVWVTQA
jgi:hypothetical protein